jgi:hypothetical protein
MIGRTASFTTKVSIYSTFGHTGGHSIPDLLDDSTLHAMQMKLNKETLILELSGVGAHSSTT